MRTIVVGVCSVAAMTLALASADEDHHHAGGDPEQVGNVRFAVSCSVPAQAQFEHAVALLHSFWYEQAEQAFGRVVATDPRCAMGYWGQAMSNWHPLWEPPTAAELTRGRTAAERARATPAPTAREKGYVAAVDAFYAGDRPLRARVVAYAEQMERVRRANPDDLEATIFCALALDALQRPDDKTRSDALAAGRLLDEVLPKLPNHPGVAHYIIHSYDYPELAARGLPAARQYAKIAPGVPHALHMPSHIFTRLGLWQESIQSNLAASAAGKAFAERSHMGASWSEQIHATDYLEYAYLQGAQDKQARRILDETIAIERVSPEDMKSAYALAAVPARYALERERWADAAQVALHPGLPWSRYPWTEAIVWFARGLGAGRTGDLKSAHNALDRLDAIHQGLAQAKNDYWGAGVEVQRLAVAAFVARMEKKDAEAERLMRSAAELEDSLEKHAVTPGAVLPARELYGDLLLELGKPAPALAAYEASLQRAPNRFYALSGAARAAKRAGDAAKTRAYYGKLAAQCDHADGERPALDEARAYLAKRR
jgi:hypothetical protein